MASAGSATRPALEALLSPAELPALAARDLRETVCVVFDVLRATSTMVTALAHGAAAIVPVAEIAEAVALRRQRPEVLLAGERDGVRIRGALSGGVEFDLGNSPREMTAQAVGGKTIVMTTTNGTRALRACGGARHVLAASFLNLGATAEWLRARRPARLALVCSGTHEDPALEDVLAAGALCAAMLPTLADARLSDGAQIALHVFRAYERDPAAAAHHSRNGRRLLALPDLRDDVELCFRRDVFDRVAEMQADGDVR